jgi:hypothetical protein
LLKHISLAEPSYVSGNNWSITTIFPMTFSGTFSIRKFIFLVALRLSTIWDFVTTFLGILIVLENLNLIAISLAVMGTLIVLTFNFSTRAIWRWRGRRAFWSPQLLMLKLVWCIAIAVDLWTSLTCNAWFVSPQFPQASLAPLALLNTLNPGQLIIVVFVTFATSISPMLAGYLKGHNLDQLLD